MLKFTLKSKFVLLIAILILLYLSACVPDHDSSFECIPPIDDFAYPIDQSTSSFPTPTQVSLDTSWTPQLDNPILGYTLQVLVKNNEQLWILGENLYSFTPSTQQVKKYSIKWNDEQYTPQSLFLARDGTLWGYGFFKGTKPLLSKYNSQTDRFEPELDNDKLLLAKGTGGSLVEDSKGQLWITNDGLYVFDPKTGVVEQKLPEKNQNGKMNGDIAIDIKDRVWLGMRADSSEFPFVLRYDPNSNQSTVIALPPEIPDPVHGLLIDSKSRVWVSDYAYRYIDAPIPTEDYIGWNMIIRSKDFIAQSVAFYDYKWVRPRPIFEDSKGNIWFSSFGLVRLDTTSGEWCRVTDREIVNIAEDSDSNFWTVNGGQLYKHE